MLYNTGTGKIKTSFTSTNKEYIGDQFPSYYRKEFNRNELLFLRNSSGFNHFCMFCW